MLINQDKIKKSETVTGIRAFIVELIKFKETEIKSGVVSSWAVSIYYGSSANNRSRILSELFGRVFNDSSKISVKEGN